MPVAIASELLEAVEHLPANTSLVRGDVAWAEYEELLAELGEGYRVRVFYDRGKLEIMAPVSEHEKPIRFVSYLVRILCEEAAWDNEAFGSTTLRRERDAKGAEPDESFYIQTAAQVIGKAGNLDLAHDPPPDLVIEVDYTSSSLDKFAIYAVLGVPEFWRWRKGAIIFFQLAGNRYVEQTHSRAFSFLSSQILTDFLTQGLREGEARAARAFRAWTREQLDA